MQHTLLDKVHNKKGAKFQEVSSFISEKSSIFWYIFYREITHVECVLSIL